MYSIFIAFASHPQAACKSEKDQERRQVKLISRIMEVSCLIQNAWLRRNLLPGEFEIRPGSALIDEKFLVEGAGNTILYLGYALLPFHLGRVDRDKVVVVPFLVTMVTNKSDADFYVETNQVIGSIEEVQSATPSDVIFFSEDKQEQVEAEKSTVPKINTWTESNKQEDYEVPRELDNGVVYAVQKMTGGHAQKWVLHRNMLLLCELLEGITQENNSENKTTRPMSTRQNQKKQRKVVYIVKRVDGNTEVIHFMKRPTQCFIEAVIAHRWPGEC